MCTTHAAPRVALLHVHASASAHGHAAVFGEAADSADGAGSTQTPLACAARKRFRQLTRESWRCASECTVVRDGRRSESKTPASRWVAGGGWPAGGDTHRIRSIRQRTWSRASTGQDGRSQFYPRLCTSICFHVHFQRQCTR